MIKVYLGLGSNVGDRERYIKDAIKNLSKYIHNMEVSKFYISKAVGYENQGDFVNCVVGGNTTLSPKSLLDFCQSVEKEVGRIYRFKWGPREIDIDILLYGDEIINLPDLKIPHPYMLHRDFVLVPLLELNERLIDPISKKPLKFYLQNLKEKSVITILD